MLLNNARTDLAAEANTLWRQSAGKTTVLKGVEAHTEELSGYKVDEVKILDENGSKELCKPIGNYLTLELDKLLRRGDNAFEDAVTALSSLFTRLNFPQSGDILVACLGNPAVTPDAVGPLTAENVLVTRHLKSSMPEDFAGFRSVSVMRTGVLGTTGVESAELVRATCKQISPAVVVCIDALASADLSRLCRTVQLTDTGIAPGSGVGNDRAALNADFLGVPVVAVGIPTVVDAGAFTSEQLAQGMFVTPRNIDDMVRRTAKLIGYALNTAFHAGITIGDIDMLLE